MIIDLQTHLWSNLEQLGTEFAQRLRSRQPNYWGQFDGSPDAHEGAMSCVTASLVLGFRSELLGARIPNEFIVEYVGKDSDRRLGVAGIDPMADDAMEQVDAAVGMGMVAITVSPPCQGFHPTHSAAMRIYERCVEARLPVLVTTIDPMTPSSMLEFARPSLWDEVARSFPTLPIVIGGLGHPWIEETLVLVGKHDNVFADLAKVAARPWQLYNALLSATAYGVMDKLLFASGFPENTPEKTIEALYSVNGFSHGSQMPSIPRTQIRGIVERNSLACLGIDAEITEGATAARDLDPAELEADDALVQHDTTANPSDIGGAQ